MPVFSLAYAAQFALPVFTNEDTFLLMGGEVKYLELPNVIAALLLAIIGIIALQAGYYWLQTSSYKNVLPVARLGFCRPRSWW
jgi:hypothetical protein